MSPFGIGLWIENFKSLPSPHWLEAVMNIFGLHKFEYIQTHARWMEINSCQDIKSSIMVIYCYNSKTYQSLVSVN